MAESSSLSEKLRVRLVDAIMEAGRYFGVLILGITIDDQPGGIMVVISVESELGEKSGGFSFRGSDGKEFASALASIKRIVGDWTK